MMVLRSQAQLSHQVEVTVTDILLDAVAPTIDIDDIATGVEATSVGLSVTITGGTYDTLAYSWTASGGTLTNATTATPTWTRPTVSVATDYTISLTVTATGTGTMATDGTSATRSDTETGRVLNALATPNAPTLDAAGSNSLTVRVSAVPGATSYKWRYSTDSTVNDFDPSTTSTSSVVTITGLTPTTNYWIDVQALDAESQVTPFSADLATATIAGVAAPTVMIGSIDTVEAGSATRLRPRLAAETTMATPTTSGEIISDPPWGTIADDDEASATFNAGNPSAAADHHCTMYGDRIRGRHKRTE